MYEDEYEFWFDRDLTRNDFAEEIIEAESEE